MENNILKPFTCTHNNCLKAFKTKKALDDHERIHTGNKPFVCYLDTCGKQFTQYSSLQKHERIHRNERPYACGECGHAFTQVSNLKRHERLHAGEKPHACSVCDKSFSTLSNLRQHIQIHDTEQERSKFECVKCNKTYLYQSSLNKHLRSHERAERNRTALSDSSSLRPTQESSESSFQDAPALVKKIQQEDTTTGTPQFKPATNTIEVFPQLFAFETLTRGFNFEYQYLTDLSFQMLGTNDKFNPNFQVKEEAVSQPENLYNFVEVFDPQDHFMPLAFEQQNTRQQAEFNFEEDYLSGTMSGTSLKSYDAEEGVHKAALDQQCDDMIKFDDSDLKHGGDLGCFYEDALAINLFNAQKQRELYEAFHFNIEFP